MPLSMAQPGFSASDHLQLPPAPHSPAQLPPQIHPVSHGEGVRCLQDLSYTPPPGAQRSAHAHTADLWLPPASFRGPMPVLLHIHGGSWVRGDKSRRSYGAPQLGRALAAQGVAVVSVNYRLSPPPLPLLLLRACMSILIFSLLCGYVGLCPPSVRAYAALVFGLFLFFVFQSRIVRASRTGSWPAPLHDVAAAAQWVQTTVRTHCPEADPFERLFLSGAGAGAHMAVMSALRGDVDARGIVCIAGVYDLRRPYGGVRASDSLVVRCGLSLLNATWQLFVVRPVVGSAIDENSPQSKVEQTPSAALPPMLLVDAVGGGRRSDFFASAWSRRGGDVTRHKVAGASEATLAFRFGDVSQNDAAHAAAAWIHGCCGGGGIASIGTTLPVAMPV